METMQKKKKESMEMDHSVRTQELQAEQSVWGLSELGWNLVLALESHE
jgi:hypothetical protein